MTNFKTNEEKLIKKMLEDNDSRIQFLSINNSGKTLTCIGNSKIQSLQLIIAYLSNNQTICMGHKVNEHFVIPHVEDNLELRVIIDRRMEGDRKFYITCNQKGSFFSEDTEPSSSSEILMLYFESENFAQLTFFNNSLDQKVSEITADNPRAIRNIRNVSQNFTNLINTKKIANDEQKEA